MKEKNREEIAERLYAQKELLESKKEEKQRLQSYNPKKADKLRSEIETLKQELLTLENELKAADTHYSPAKKTLAGEKEQLYALLAPLDRYMQQGAAALKKRRILLFFARHPKVVLAQMLHQGAEEAKTLPKKIAPFKEGAYGELCEKIERFCQTLVDHSNRRWNHALYSGEFLSLYEEWDRLLQKLRPDA